MLRLLSYEGFRDPEEVVAENRHLTQAFSSSNGVRHLIQDFRRWNSASMPAATVLTLARIGAIA
jgi:hypothetical protein